MIVIRPSVLADIPELRDVEMDAGAMFREIGLGAIADGDPPPASTLAEHVRAGTAWTAELDSVVVGYAVASVVDGEGHLDQVSVRTAAAGRGIGRLLIDEVCDWAARCGHGAVTLTTFSQVPWNGPYYARLGFRELPTEGWGPDLAEIRRREQLAGIDVAPRIAMRLLLGDRAAGPGPPQPTGNAPAAADYAAAVANDPDYTLLDRGGISAQIFFPRPDPSPAPAGATDHVVEVDAGVSIGARRYEIDPHGPTIVYFHGNGEVVGDHDYIAPLYHSIGVNLFVFEFRGYGRSTGSPTIAHLVADGATCGRRALELLDADGFDGPRFVMGRSLGANPALEVAARVPGYGGLILESGAGNIVRFVRRLGLQPGAELDQLVAAHAAKLATITMPTLIIHGLADDLVPVDNALATADLLTASDVVTELVEGAGHNDLLLVDPGRYIEAIARLIDRAQRDT